MFNIGNITKILDIKKKFETNHPKFAAMIGTIASGNMVENGSIIELTITKADGTKVTGNMKVNEEDIEMMQQIKSMNM